MKTIHKRLYNDGDKVNNLTILNLYQTIHNKNYYNCKCICGKIFIAREFDIKNNIVTSCGHDIIIPKLKLAIIGKRFGRLIVEKFDHMYNHASYYQCKCDCGKLIIVASNALTAGKILSCGCYHNEIHQKRIFKHGFVNTGFYEKWQALKARCSNPNCKEYHNYGGRGITYDPKWETFEGYKDDMYESYIKHVEEYGEKDTTIDRIDVNGNYCKDNCRWATIKEQGNNKRYTKYIYCGNNKYTIEEAIDKFGNKELIPKTIVYDRIVKQHLDPIISVMFPSSYIQSYHKEMRPKIDKYYKEHNVPIRVATKSKIISYTAELEYLRTHSPFKFK